MLRARPSSCLAVLAVVSTLITGPTAAAATATLAPLPQQIAVPPAWQNLPAQMLQLTGSGAGHDPVLLERKAPGDVTLFGIGNPTAAADTTAGISTVGSVVYVPQAPDGGALPTQVTIKDTGSAVTVPVHAGERYLAGAGDHSILLGTTSAWGAELTLRSSTGDSLVTTLPAGTVDSIGSVSADATTALLAYTPDGATVPVIDAVSLADGTVNQVNSTSLREAAPLVALSPGAFAWTDASAVVRTARDSTGAETRRTTTDDVTALAVLDGSTGWISGSHLYTAVLDSSVDPMDHGQVDDPTLIAPTYGSDYAAAVNSGATCGSTSSRPPRSPASTRASWTGSTRSSRTSAWTPVASSCCRTAQPPVSRHCRSWSRTVPSPRGATWGPSSSLRRVAD